MYRYYVSTGVQTGRRRSSLDDAIRRVPAAAIERLVRDSVQDTLDAVERVEVHPTCVHIVIDPVGLLGRPLDPADAAIEVQARLAVSQRVLVEAGTQARVRIIQSVRLALRGGKIVITDVNGRRADPHQRTDLVLARALRTSHELLAGLGDGAVGRPEQAILAASPASAYDRNLIKLAFLAPDLQIRILEGRQPSGLTLQAIIGADLPASWPDQLAWAEALN
ncbi:MAG: hypothetical protein EPN98_13730 [Phenylobacterium sp.]|uniref:hypothetical protein n=1 Tax=Phenylobacterium sp. TaxID=1871053 RepID=UPI00121D9F3B|nr:hypothetical protein [Phenylobacterium sp.]TAL32614.1 MAG: hypothetical protein EPN98_13730 [Phenylobacterium sp.]